MRCGRWLVIASTRSWWVASITSTLAPSLCQNAASFATAFPSAPAGGVRIHQRSSNNSAKPASGPECSVPATGCAGTRWACFGTCGAMSRNTAPLTEPTSETMAPGAIEAAISAATFPLTPTGMQMMMQSAPFAASALVSTTSSAFPSSRTRLRVAAERAVATIERTAPWARAARAIDAPIKPTPISASRSNTGGDFSGTGGLARHELAERRDRQPVRLLGADAHAERMRQVIGAGLPQHEAAFHEEAVRVLRRLAALLREVDQHEIRRTRRHLEPERADLLLEPGKPLRIVRGRALEMRLIAERGDPRRHRRRVDIERSADAVHRVDHGSGRVHPAEPQRREPVDLGKGPRHHDVFARRRKLDARFIIVAPHVFGIGGIEYEEHARGQRRMQPPHLRKRQIGAGGIVRIG